MVFHENGGGDDQESLVLAWSLATVLLFFAGHVRVVHCAFFPRSYGPGRSVAVILW